MSLTLRRTLATVLLAGLIALAGCGGPGASTVESPVGENETVADNDAGAEPVNPPNGTTGEATEIEAGDAQNDSNGSGNDTGGNTTAGNGTGGNTTGNDTGEATTVPTE